jgi:hypothetical protein
MQHQDDQPIAQLPTLAATHAFELFEQVLPIQSVQLTSTQVANSIFETAQVIGFIADRGGGYAS